LALAASTSAGAPPPAKNAAENVDTQNAEVYDLFNNSAPEAVENNGGNDDADASDDAFLNEEIDNANANVNANANANANTGQNAQAQANGNQADGNANAATARTTLRHPKGPSRWRTNEMLLLVELPKRSLLETCRKETLAMGKEALNPEMLVAAIAAVRDGIRENKELYHYCFYYAVLNLELSLDSDGLNRSYVEKYTYFVDRMKAYWILARALDVEFKSRKYFGYLRHRFLDSSLEHFGRRLQIMSAPLGDSNHRLIPNLNPKPAGTNQ